MRERVIRVLHLTGYYASQGWYCQDIHWQIPAEEINRNMTNNNTETNLMLRDPLSTVHRRHGHTPSQCIDNACLTGQQLPM